MDSMGDLKDDTGPKNLCMAAKKPSKSDYLVRT
jgi:hypothetical protein